jgi:hypothetical protein
VGQADASAGLRVALAVGGVLALLVALAGCVQAFRSPASDSTLHDRRAWRRYGLIVGVEFALAGAGAAALAAGLADWVPPSTVTGLGAGVLLTLFAATALAGVEVGASGKGAGRR